jgi:uncharacterized protein (UPF0262 family)
MVQGAGTDERTMTEGRLIAVDLDTGSLSAARAFVERERATALHDLLADNAFGLVGRTGGAFRLRLSVADGKLVLDVADEADAPVARHILSLTPFRRVVKDYFLICDAYYAAVGGLAPAQIEAIDVGRRGLHNEGAEILRERLAGKISVDFPTARRLFTLLCALYWKG